MLKSCTIRDNTMKLNKINYKINAMVFKNMKEIHVILERLEDIKTSFYHVGTFPIFEIGIVNGSSQSQQPAQFTALSSQPFSRLRTLNVFLIFSSCD